MIRICAFVLVPVLVFLNITCKAPAKLAQNTGPYNLITTGELLYAAVNKAKPGDTVYIEDGTYKDLKLVISNNGEKAKPIRILARNPGKVFFTGDARIELRGDYLVLEGIYFKNGSRNPGKWASHGPGLVAVYGSYNRVTNCAFDAFDEASSAYISTSPAPDGKVPAHCRIDHCTFINKITFDQVINLNNTAAAVKEGPGGPPMYHRIDHNFFSNPPKPGNAGGAIRIGYYRNDTGRCLVDSNLFMRQDSEPEIITGKSQENIYYANTFLNCRGTLNFRHGDRQVAVNNFFVGNDNKYEYGGMFVWGSKHIIAANYFELPKTISSRGNAALYLNPGAVNSEHSLAFDLLIANNFFINVNGYAIHFNPLDERRKALCKENNLQFDTPHDLTIRGNLFFSNGKSKFPFFKNDYENMHLFQWSDNIAYGSETGMHVGDGIRRRAVLLSGSAGYYFPEASSGYYPADFTGIQNIEGIDLPLCQLVSRGIKGKPVGFSEVGVSWIKDIPEYARTGILPAAIQERFDRVLQSNNKKPGKK